MFSAKVEAYELVKLRLLNGTHSLIAYLGALDGRATIPDARAQEFVERAAAWRPSPTSTCRASRSRTRFDAEAYVEQLFRRWSNSALGHRTSAGRVRRLGEAGQRVPSTRAAHARPTAGCRTHLALTVAAWLCCVAPSRASTPARMRRP